jgi:hypothetical protein
MPAGLSAGARNSILDAIGNATAFSFAAVWVKLHTGDPGAAGTSNPAGTTTRQSASFAAASSQSMTTDADLLWSSVGTAETISWISLWDASTAGTFIGAKDLTAAKTVAVGDNFRIPAGSLTITD